MDVLRQTSCIITTHHQEGHVSVVCLHDPHSFFLYQWTSSMPLIDNYVINYKMFHAYLCSGMLTVQYEKLCEHASIGLPTAYFRNKTIPIYGSAVEVVKTRSIDASLGSRKGVK